eukprot:1158368-Pelagomonas_calceolata.AAC.4
MGVRDGSAHPLPDVIIQRGGPTEAAKIDEEGRQQHVCPCTQLPSLQTIIAPKGCELEHHN